MNLRPWRKPAPTEPSSDPIEDPFTAAALIRTAALLKAHPLRDELAELLADGRAHLTTMPTEQAGRLDVFVAVWPAHGSAVADPRLDGKRFLLGRLPDRDHADLTDVLVA